MPRTTFKSQPTMTGLVLVTASSIKFPAVMRCKEFRIWIEFWLASFENVVPHKFAEIAVSKDIPASIGTFEDSQFWKIEIR